MRALAGLLLIVCATPFAARPEAPPGARPNALDRDGTPGFVRFEATDMPLRVALGTPRVVARDTDGPALRRAVVALLDEWQGVLRAAWPALELDIREAHEDPHLRIDWVRRTSHQLPARAGRRVRVLPDGGIELRTRITASAVPLSLEHQLTAGELIDWLRPAVGAALGLASCHACEAATSRDWRRRGPRRVGAADAGAFAALMSTPNGVRVDGSRLGAPDPDAAGVRAALALENLGEADRLAVDLAAAPGDPWIAAPLTAFPDVVVSSAVAPPRPARSSWPAPVPTRAGVAVLPSVREVALMGGARSPVQRWAGEALLGRFVIDLDAAAGRLRLLDPRLHSVGDQLTPFEQERVIPIERVQGLPYVRISVDGRQVRALLATGAPLALWLPGPGPRQAGRLEIAGLVSGPVPVERDPAALPPHLAGRTGGPIVGAGLLRSFRLRIDLARGRLGLTPAGAPGARGYTAGSQRRED